MVQGKPPRSRNLESGFIEEGRTILFGAADTFRAAAVDQLQVWGERLKLR